MKYKIAIWATIVSFFLTVSLPSLFSKDSGQSHAQLSLQSFDLNGMLKTINEKTKQLGSINQQILHGLLSIDEKSSQTKAVSEKLHLVNQVANVQGELLGNIRDVTGQQVTLSQKLNALSQQLAIQMGFISNSGQAQMQKSTQLKSITKDTQTKLKEALEQNKILEQKLQSAASKSERAANSLP